MGMAASQARLLSLTARIHDVEQQAQSIQNAKINLATLSDRAYEKYNEALEATTLTINTINTKSGEKTIIPANFNNLCSHNRVTASTGENYAIRNKEGLLLVEDDIEEAYYEFREAGLNDPFAFAVYILNDKNVNHLGNLDDLDSENSFIKNLQKKEEEAFNKINENEALENLHNELSKIAYDSDDIYSGPKDGIQEDSYQAKLNLYRNELYRLYGDGVYHYARNEQAPEETNNGLIDYYINIFKQIQACGGCVSVSDYNGMNGDAANDTDWLQSMVQSGQFSIEVINTDSKTGKISFDATSPSSDSCLSYTNTTMIDNRALAKAEAEYEHTLKDIDKKDQRFDLDLSKLETQRTALTKEYDSVKKVIEDNIDRTFGIFS